MAFDESLNVRHISDHPEDYEAARTGFFVLLVSGLENLRQPSYSGEDDPAIGSTDWIPSDAADTLRLNIVKCPVPHFEISTNEYRRGNDVVHFAGIPTWNGGTFVVDDIVGKRTKEILMAWLYLAYNPHTRKGGRMKDYKKNCQLIEYTQDYEPIRTWNLDGVFITKLQEDDFDRENDGPRKISADFIFDRATLATDTVE